MSACESGCMVTCLSGCQTACEACQTTCETTCQNCQGVACQTCQASCEKVCQNCQGVACQTCQTSCQLYCQNCQGAACQTCQTACETACQNCEGNVCESACQTVCESACQNCEGGACQSACQTTCESACQSACELTAQIEPTWTWNFHAVTVIEPIGVKEVRALWSGIVNGVEVLCAVANGHLWQLALTDGVWSKTDCGSVTDAAETSLFGFSDKLYILNGTQYKVWNGTTLSDVTGYRPMVSVATPPAGGGTELEQINKLNGTRRARYSPTGTDTVFYLPENPVVTIDYVKNVATGQSITGWTGDTTNGKLTFTSAPAEGVNTIEIGWTVSTSYADTVKHMHFSELFNGWQDSRVFLFGDGTNQAIYSGLTYEGTPSAEYFPDLNVLRVGDENTPITDMIRNYSKLLAFKTDSTWSIGYDTLTLEDGRTIPGFYIKPVNRDVGNVAPGQAVLVGNRPRTLDDRAIIEWAPGRGGYLTADERNAERVSQRVHKTIQTFDLKTARAFYDKIHHEYYVIGANGNVLVHNTDADAWYVYRNLPATCMIVYKDEVYFGTPDGYIRHLSSDYRSDNGAAISAAWDSGAMDFSQDFKRKYSAMLWLGIKPENKAAIQVSAETDRKTDFANYTAEGGANGDVPDVDRVKLKAKKFTYYKLKLLTDTADTTATVVSADIRVRGTGYAK